MITFSERFQFEKDNYGWMLHEWRIGKDKDGNPKRHKDTTYHANLEQIFKAIIDKSAGDCESMDEIKGLLKSMTVKPISLARESA